MKSIFCCVFQRARDAVASLRSSMLMALDVAKSLSEASLSQKAKCYRRWDCMDRQTDCPELASNVHQFLGAEEAKATLNNTESLAMSGRGGLATGVTALTSRLPGTKANRLERRPLTYGADHSGDSSRLGHWSFLEQQQVKRVVLTSVLPMGPGEMGPCESGSCGVGRSICPGELSPQGEGKVWRQRTLCDVTQNPVAQSTASPDTTSAVVHSKMC